ncbi:hypothetical protein H6P81_015204 [Aristolochia fimbriata]|uniref:ATP synthase F0 subunit 8 n=1 Tax=Aristolochia fimbriata TaxID=158543 RepID=A0AAV7E5H6_ARIFI|nr:hypothetical protein H6P81_015204 [Aristolochia fimbriata]
MDLERPTSDGGNEKSQGPGFVTFPSAKFTEPPPLKLEVEESAEAMSPKNMWQIYALGGFMVLKWLWARWSEKRGRDQSSEEHPTGY